MANYSQFKNWLLQSSLVNEDDFAMVEPYLTEKKIKEGDYFLTEGAICWQIGFINTGCFRSFYLKDGKEINSRFFFEYDIVEEYDSFLLSTPSKYFVQALEDAEIICFDLATLQNAFDKSKNWERLGRIMAEKACTNSGKRVESLLFYTGEERYINLLNETPEIFNRLPLFHIASYLGMERESLSRIRRKVKAEPAL